MLDVFRENLRSLKWVLLLVVASFVVALFAVWGGGATGRSGGPSWVARVEGTAITVPDVQERAGRLDAQYRQLYGQEQYQQLRPSLDLFGAALQQLIDEELLLNEADRLGIQVTDGELNDNIRKNPGLQENGRFIGRDRYLELARSGEFDARHFEEGIRRNLRIGKIRDLLWDGIQVSDAEVLAAYRQQNEKINADFVTLSPAAIADRVEVSDAEIEEAFRVRQEAYREPERRQGAYVELETMKVGENIHPTDDDVYRYYQDNLATKYTHQDQRRAAHILFRVPPDADAEATAAIEARASEVLGRIRSGEDFAEMARQYSEDGSAKNGGDLGYFGKGAMVPAFEQGVWALKVGEVSDLIRTQFGFHIIKLLDIQTNRVDTFEEVQGKIHNVVRFQMAMDETGRQLRELKAAMGDLENFRTVAEQKGLTVHETGLVAAGGTIDSVSASQLVVQQLFRLQPGEISDPFGMPNGQILLVLEKTVPGDIPPLADVRDRVAADLREDKGFDWLKGKVEERSASGSEATLAEFAADLGLELSQASDLQRGLSLPDLPETAGLVETAFDMSEGDWIGPRRLGSGDILLVQITAKTGSMDGFDAQRAGISRRLLQEKRFAHLGAVIDRLRNTGSVERNTVLLARLQQQQQ